jgi:guanylate kinase
VKSEGKSENRTKRLNGLWVTPKEMEHFERILKDRNQKESEAVRGALQKAGLLPGGEGTTHER